MSDFKFNNINIRIYKFNDVVIISRPKFASRVLDELFKEFYHNQLDLEKLNIGNNLVNFRINPITRELVNEFDSDSYVSNIKDELLNTEGLSKLEKKNLIESIDDMLLIQSDIKETWNSIVNKSYEGKVFIVYRNPYEALVTGICQDIFDDMNSFYRMMYDNKIIFDICKDQYTSLLSSDIKYFKPLNLSDTYLSDDTIKIFKESEGFQEFYSNFIINHIDSKGLQDSHKGLYLSYLFNFIDVSEKENLYYVNLDSTDEIDFRRILSDYGDITFEYKINSYNSKQPIEKRKHSNGFYKEIAKKTISNDNRIYNRIKEFLDLEQRYFDYIKKFESNI